MSTTPSPWLTATLRDDFTRQQLRAALHEAIHLRAGPLVPLLQDVLADGGLQFANVDRPAALHPQLSDRQHD
jgi:hypothetical protein